MKKTILPLLVFSIILLLSSCASSEGIVYFQDVEGVELKDSILNFEPKVQVGDLLFINVSATDAEAALPFNLYETPILMNSYSSASRPLTYLVNSEGVINFPVLGSFEVGGLTTNELTAKLEGELTEYLNDPIINIRITNFKISVVGEVKRPGSFPIENEQVTLLEAISLAGDLSIYGIRESVMLIREVDGKKEFITLDLTNKELFNSPYYYLKQNDVIYVAPNKTKVNASVVGPNTAIILSSASLLIALLAIIIK